MYPHVAEVGAQAGLHKSAGLAIEDSPTAGANNVFYERWLLLFQRRADCGVASGLLEMHDGGRRQRVGAPVHQRLRSGRLALILLACRGLVTLGIQQEVGVVRLHTHTSVRHELTMLPKGAEGPSG